MTALATIPTAHPSATKDRPAPVKISGKVQDAINAMVWLGLPRAEAAAKAGLSEHGLYKALRKPPVKAALLREMDVLRLSERPRNIKRLVEIRDAADNMPAVNAIKMLEELGSDIQAKSNASVSLPGLTIQIINAPGAPHAAMTIEHDAATSHNPSD